MAICRIEGGVAFTECISPPEDVTKAATIARDSNWEQALVAGQRISNWTLSNFYRQRREAFAPLKEQDIHVLEAGLNGAPMQNFGAGLSLAPETRDPVTDVVRAAKEDRRMIAFGKGWSAPEAWLAEFYARFGSEKWLNSYDPQSSLRRWLRE